MENLKCPKCKNHSIRVENLLSYPVQYDCFCYKKGCDFELPFFERADSRKIITQEELDKEGLK